MKIEKACKIFELINEILISDSNKPFDALNKVFIPSYFKKELILRSSSKGMITAWLKNKETQDEQIDQIKKIVIKAFHQINKSEKYNSVPLSVRFSLEKLVNQETISKQKYKKKFPETVQVEELNHMNVIQKKKIREKIRLESFLKKQTSVSEINLNKWNAILSYDGSFNIEFLTKLVEYLKLNPDYAQKGFEKTLPLLIQGLEESDSYIKTFTASQDDQELRGIKRKDLAIALANEAFQLKPNEKKLFCGSFGKRIDSFKALSTTLDYWKNLLPESIQETIPEPIREFLNHKDIYLKNPVDVIKTFLNEQSKYFNEKCTNESFDIKNSIFNILFAHQDRKVPEALSNFLPLFLETPLMSWFQQGLIGNAMEFVQDGPIREMFLLLSEHGNTLDDPLKREKILQEAESLIIKLLTPSVEIAMNGVNQGIKKSHEQFFNSLPPFIQEIIGNQASATPFWIEYEKTENQTFNLMIYSTRQGLDFHEKVENDEKTLTAWPLRLINVPQERLDSLFFDRLLMHFIEPSLNPEFISDPQDLYEGLIASLGAQVENHHFIHCPSSLKEGEIAEHLLIKPEIDSRLIRYYLLKDSFISFSQPYLKSKEGYLTFSSVNEWKMIDSGMQKIIQLAKELGDLISQEEWIQLKATEKDIRLEFLALQERNLTSKFESQAHSKTYLPTQFFDEISKIISSQSLREIKPSLIWALGDDFEIIIDEWIIKIEYSEKCQPTVFGIQSNINSLESTKNDPPNDVKNNVASKTSNFLDEIRALFPIKERPKGWLRTIIFSVYWSIAFQALRHAHLAWTTYQSGLDFFKSPLFFSMITPYLYQGASVVAPFVKEHTPEEIISLIQLSYPFYEKGIRVIEQINEWYRELKITIAQWIFSHLIELGLTHVATKEQKNDIINLFTKYRDASKWLTKQMLGKEEIDFKFAGPMISEKKTLMLRNCMFPHYSKQNMDKYIFVAPGIPISYEKQKFEFKTGLQTIYTWIKHSKFLRFESSQNYHSDLISTFPYDYSTSSTQYSSARNYEQTISLDIRKKKYQDKWSLSSLFFNTNQMFDHNRNQTILFENFTCLSSHYLFNHIEQMVFQSTDLNEWTHLNNDEISLYLAALSDLGIELSTAVEGDNGRGVAFYTRFITNMFLILMLMDKVAKQCSNANLDGYPLNIYPLFIWLRDNISYIEDPIILKSMEKICSYFTPDLNIYHLPSKKDLQELSKNCLFNFKHSKHLDNGYSLFDEYPNFLWSEEVCGLENLETCYYENFLEHSNFKVKSGIRNYETIYFSQWKSILLELSLDFNINNPLPISFRLLKLQTINCFRFLHDLNLSDNCFYRSLKPLKKNKMQSVNVKNYFNGNFNEIYRWDKIISVVGVISVIDNKITSFIENSFNLTKFHPEPSLARGYKQLSSDPTNYLSQSLNVSDSYVKKLTQKKSQSTIISNPQPPLLCDNSILDRQQREMILSERSDQVIRTLTYYSQNKD
ncbi:MAG: hypothetical protein Q8K60_00050, partial [Parachlamydiaceae bacterium]|nr:hypothetical protein [Parachlamydiaceae bacterium]